MLKRIAVLVSGSGTNLQALIDAEQAGQLPSGEIVLVLADRPGAFALERAQRAGIAARCINKRAYSDPAAFEAQLLGELQTARIDLVVLAGFLSILSQRFVKHYHDRIINIHPSLIPAFCGAGYYGLRVHQAALERGVKLTGATVHFVNEIPDGGRIIAQKAVAVLPDDTPETLQRRVMEEAEWQLLPLAVEEVCKNGGTI